MAYSDHLVGLALSTKWRTISFSNLAHSFEAVPKFDCCASVIWILKSFGDLSILNFFSVLTAKLKFIAVIINRPRFISHHKYATLNLANNVLEGLSARLQIDIGHTIDRSTIPRGRSKICDSG